MSKGYESGEQHRRVLVVEDDRDVRGVLTTALGRRALVVDEAQDGRRGIELLSERPYAVLLLDLRVPEIDGYGVLEAMSSMQLDPQPVVLVVTGADDRMLERLDPRRIHGLVRKPFDPEEIAEVVAACVEFRGRSAFEAMAIATIVSSAPLIALLKL